MERRIDKHSQSSSRQRSLEIDKQEVQYKLRWEILCPVIRSCWWGRCIIYGQSSTPHFEANESRFLPWLALKLVRSWRHL